jgi:hypothetical protein
MRNDALMHALLGRPEPSSADPEAPIPPEGGYRTSPPVPKRPAQEHSDELGDLLATRRFDSQQ